MCLCIWNTRMLIYEFSPRPWPKTNSFRAYARNNYYVLRETRNGIYFIYYRFGYFIIFFFVSPYLPPSHHRTRTSLARKCVPTNEGKNGPRVARKLV